MKPNFLQLNINIFNQGNRFVAYSPALDISTSGKNKTETKQRFEELVDIFFEELEEDGILEDVLSDLGWKKSNKKWEPPKIDTKSIKVRIPLSV